MALVLHAGRTNKNALKVLITAEYCAVDIELVKNFQMGVSNKTPEFLKMNPLGKVPVLETPDGPIFESNAIARYVARLNADNPIYGISLIEYAHIEQWIDFATTEIDPNICRWFYPRAGYSLYSLQAEEDAIILLKRALGALNTHLATNTYLVGHGITLADIIMICNLYLGFIRLMPKSFTSEFPHVERYFWTMVNQPNFCKVMGKVEQTQSVHPLQSLIINTQSKLKEPEKEAMKQGVNAVIEDLEPCDGEALLDAKCFN
ncbi:putative glutathione transferase [Dioscorea sansibarensis]